MGGWGDEEEPGGEGGTKAKQKELHVTQNRLGMEARVWEREYSE